MKLYFDKTTVCSAGSDRILELNLRQRPSCVFITGAGAAVPRRMLFSEAKYVVFLVAQNILSRQGILMHKFWKKKTHLSRVTQEILNCQWQVELYWPKLLHTEMNAKMKGDLRYASFPPDCRAD